MKRYLLFIGESYYPNMAMGDLVGDYDTLEEARDAMRKKVFEDSKIYVRMSDYISDHFIKIYDTQTRKYVE